MDFIVLKRLDAPTTWSQIRKFLFSAETNSRNFSLPKSTSKVIKNEIVLIDDGNCNFLKVSEG